jgi:hypothetical protein
MQWEGTFGDFLTNVVPGNPAAFARTSHQYIWDMLRWYGRDGEGQDEATKAKALFKRELFGVDEPLARVVDYFKAAAAGSDVGRRLLLLLGPPSGGKSTMAILLKRGLEEYSRTDEGAMYGIKGSPMHESPLNSDSRQSAREFRDTYGVELNGRVEPVGARTLGARIRGRLPARAGGTHLYLRGHAHGRGHIRSARSDHRRYRRSRRLRRSLQSGRSGRRRRSARVELVRRGVRRQPRHARDDRNSESEARVPVPVADAHAGKERQGVAFPAHPLG